jgi:hypothetical protein
MNYYLIFQENALQIVPVKPDQEKCFCLQYGAQILSWGPSIAEALRKFHALPVVFSNGV